jgi:hypothetical protein
LIIATRRLPRLQDPQLDAPRQNVGEPMCRKRAWSSGAAVLTVPDGSVQVRRVALPASAVLPNQVVDAADGWSFEARNGFESVLVYLPGHPVDRLFGRPPRLYSAGDFCSKQQKPHLATIRLQRKCAESGHAEAMAERSGDRPRGRVHRVWLPLTRAPPCYSDVVVRGRHLPTREMGASVNKSCFTRAASAWTRR